MGIRYEDDIVGWAGEQAALLRSGRLDVLDLPNIAEEIEDVARAVRHELKSRMVVLLAHLLKWQFQPERRGASWAGTITHQRGEIDEILDEAPSLRRLVDDEHWLASVWRRAAALAHAETGTAVPDHWIWPVDRALDPGFWPD
ncbi:MAG TPA: DUF29 domain-containing protein [Telluria sp.]|nr:DUF29 domain-containing protein [Telluria sp.]